MKLFYILGSISMIILTSAHAMTGYDPFGSHSRTTVPQDIRRSRGGYRSFAFWRSGYFGGK